MLFSIGVPKRQITMVDSKGVINKERKDLNRYKAEFVTDNQTTTLQQAMRGADVFIGLSRGGAVTADCIMSMAERPVIFALANPIPEIEYGEAKQLRPDAVVATGRSDNPNQVNNLLAFPYLFRGALDTLSATINEKMKIAAAHAIADIAREGTPKETERLYGKKLQFGEEYILPKPGDKRLLYAVSSAVAKAAMESGVARRGIASFKEYCGTLTNRLDCENHFYHETIRHRAASKQRNRHQRLQEF
jgi:malate dehydrogenase (oxaloacetate-decarboxylating)(NADP+)